MANKLSKSKTPSLDLAELQRNVTKQFQGLDPNDPSVWPTVPKYLLCVGVAVLVVVALWYTVLSGYDEQLVREEQREVQLKEEYSQKLAKAINLEPLKDQLEQVRQYVTQLEKQLPSKAEMDQLLSDINQAGLGRSLQFELFRPGSTNLHEYYAELPIELRVVGSYSDMGLFAADVAGLSRIVTLHNINLQPVPNRADQLAVTATAKTFRYLDPEELLQQKKEMAEQKKNKTGKGKK